jgi:hypothetical protein
MIIGPSHDHGSWNNWAQATLMYLNMFKPKIERALTYTHDRTHSFDDVCYLTMNGKYAWFVSDSQKSLVLTELQQFPRKKNLHGFVACGEMKDLMQLVWDIICYYKEHHPEVMSASLTGRPGWERVMKKHGWKHTSVTMTIDEPTVRKFHDAIDEAARRASCGMTTSTEMYTQQLNLQLN